MNDPISQLESIVDNRDCEEFERWDLRYNEGRGLDISKDLYSKAYKLSMSCAMDTVNDIVKDVLDDMNG